jgi:hypothetical protein
MSIIRTNSQKIGAVSDRETRRLWVSNVELSGARKKVGSVLERVVSEAGCHKALVDASGQVMGCAVVALLRRQDIGASN